MFRIDLAEFSIRFDQWIDDGLHRCQ
jgi:hypothetical protein